MKLLYILVLLACYSIGYCQLTLETGFPSHRMNLKSNSSEYELDHYVRIGKKNLKLEKGFLGIARFGIEGGKCSDISLGPYLNYTIKPLKKVPVVLIPEVMILVKRSQYLSYFYRGPEWLLTANIGLGLGYEFQENWSIISTGNVGYGKQFPIYSGEQNLVFDFPMGVSLGVKYTFKKKE